MLNELSFHVEIWGKDFSAPYDTIATTVRMGLAVAAFEQQVREHPNQFVMIRQKARVLRRHPSEEAMNVVPFQQT